MPEPVVGVYDHHDEDRIEPGVEDVGMTLGEHDLPIQPILVL